MEKFDGGWSVGSQIYAMDGFPDGVRMLAWHQDQVIEPPQDATVVGSSPFCRYAALAYGDRAFSIQPHPEFNAQFMARLIEARREVLPEGVE